MSSPEGLLRKKPVVGPTKQPHVRSIVCASARPGGVVVQLEKACRVAAVALRVDIAAAEPIARDHFSPARIWNVPRALRSCRTKWFAELGSDHGSIIAMALRQTLLSG